MIADIPPRKVTQFTDNLTGATYYRAHVWTPAGYSSRTFLIYAEAVAWSPRPTLKGVN